MRDYSAFVATEIVVVCWPVVKDGNSANNRGIGECSVCGKESIL